MTNRPARAKTWPPAGDHFQFNYVQGSAADKSLVRRLIADVDEVYHLAAAVGLELIASAPIHTIETNLYPTELILAEMLRHRKAGHAAKLFLASSAEVYGKNPKETWSEEDSLVYGPTSHPRWSTGVAKAIGESLALAYWQQHRLPIIVGRLFNVIGPRQSGRFGMVVPRFVEAALAGRPLVVHGDGSQVRTFLHVADAVRAILDLMASPAAMAGVFNIGGDEPVTLLELARAGGGGRPARDFDRAASLSRHAGSPFRRRPASGSRFDPAPRGDRFSARARSGRHAAGDDQLHPGDAAEVVLRPAQNLRPNRYFCCGQPAKMAAVQSRVPVPDLLGTRSGTMNLLTSARLPAVRPRRCSWQLVPARPR